MAPGGGEKGYSLDPEAAHEGCTMPRPIFGDARSCNAAPEQRLRWKSPLFRPASTPERQNWGFCPVFSMPHTRYLQFAIHGIIFARIAQFATQKSSMPHRGSDWGQFVESFQNPHFSQKSPLGIKKWGFSQPLMGAAFAGRIHLARSTVLSWGRYKTVDRFKFILTVVTFI